MRRSMAAALILTVLLFGGAYLTTGGSAAQEPESGDDTAQEPSGQGRRDSTVLLTVQDGDTAEEMALDAYLRGVVRGEMPASFETEALRAQAAAERTYVYHQLAAGRKEDLVTREDSTFGRVARYIDRHYAEDLSIEQLARQFYLSPYHLSHIFRQKTGYSLKQYVLRRRLGEAQMRLVNAQDSVQTISEAVGFADASYFSRIFSKYVGLTPTEYRKFRIGP